MLIRNACSSESSSTVWPVRLRRSPTTTQSRSEKAMAGSGRVMNQPPTTRPTTTTTSAAIATGRRHTGISRRALASPRGARSGARPGSPTSCTSCTSGTPLNSQRPWLRHCSSLPRSPSSRTERRTSGSTTDDSRIWPGRASCISRAVNGLARPSISTGLAPAFTASSLLRQISTSPTCRPARASSGSVRWALPSASRPRR